MPVISVDSLADPRLAVYRDLPRSNLTRHAALFVAEGQRLVQRLIVAGLSPESILLEPRLLADVAHMFEKVGSRVPPEIDLLVAPRQLLSEIVGFRFHRGMLAAARRPTNPDRSTWLESLPAQTTIVVGSGVQDPDNLGGILRTSAALGVPAVMLGDHSADPYCRRVLRVSMGSVFRLGIFQSSDLPADLDWLRRQAGFQLAAAVLDQRAERLEQFQRPERLAIVLGSEGFGLPPERIAACDRQVTIPMQPGIDSLNVSVAAGILLYRLAQASGGRQPAVSPAPSPPRCDRTIHGR
ncbi:MAG: RNA methyltransferase [Pirellulaceae bacterium]|nr:RNA methyltransferase [Pirellulaceae bacterium]